MLSIFQLTISKILHILSSISTYYLLSVHTIFYYYMPFLSICHLLSVHTIIYQYILSSISTCYLLLLHAVFYQYMLSSLNAYHLLSVHVIFYQYMPSIRRHFVVVEEVRDRCVVTSAATATWRNVDVVDVQLLAIGNCDRNALLLQMRICWLRKSGRVVDEGDHVFY